MATKKTFKKDKLIVSIDDIITNKHKVFIIDFGNKIHHMEYNKLSIISLGTLVGYINNKRLFYATVIEEEIIRKVKQKVIPKQKSNITGCKTTLDKIYGED